VNELPDDWRLFRERLQQRAALVENVGALAIVLTPKGMKGPQLPPGAEWEHAAGKAEHGRLGLFYGGYRETERVGDGVEPGRSWTTFIRGTDDFREAMIRTMAEARELLQGRDAKEFKVALARAVYAKRPWRVKVWPEQGDCLDGRPTRTLDACPFRLVFDLPSPLATMADLLPAIRDEIGELLTPAKRMENCAIPLRQYAQAFDEWGEHSELKGAEVFERVRANLRAFLRGVATEGFFDDLAQLDDLYRAVAMPGHAATLSDLFRKGLTVKQISEEIGAGLPKAKNYKGPKPPKVWPPKRRQEVAEKCKRLAGTLEKQLKPQQREQVQQHAKNLGVAAVAQEETPQGEWIGSCTKAEVARCLWGAKTNKRARDVDLIFSAERVRPIPGSRKNWFRIDGLPVADKLRNPESK
jgi:hypothetical protein